MVKCAITFGTPNKYNYNYIYTHMFCLRHLADYLSTRPAWFTNRKSWSVCSHGLSCSRYEEAELARLRLDQLRQHEVALRTLWEAPQFFHLVSPCFHLCSFLRLSCLRRKVVEMPFWNSSCGLRTCNNKSTLSTFAAKYLHVRGFDTSNLSIFTFVGLFLFSPLLLD